jgi:hypothetical protein
MANDESEMIAECADSREREPWQPQLARAREMTPLPEIEAAMPVLGIFGGLLARRHASYKVGILRDLAGHPGARWRMREIQERVDWLKPDSVRRLEQPGWAVGHSSGARVVAAMPQANRHGPKGSQSRLQGAAIILGSSSAD